MEPTSSVERFGVSPMRKINVNKLPAISRRETSTNLGQYLIWLKKERGKIKHKLSQANKIHLLDARSYVFFLHL